METNGQSSMEEGWLPERRSGYEQVSWVKEESEQLISSTALNSFISTFLGNINTHM